MSEYDLRKPFPFEAALEQMGISPLYTPESVQKLTLYDQDSDAYQKNSVIQFQRGSHVAAYKLIHRGRDHEGSPILIVDMEHQHNVPVNRRFFKVNQGSYRAQVKSAHGERKVLESNPNTFTVIGDHHEGRDDTGNLYAWLDPSSNLGGDEKLASTFE
jgi:hypothetical protein